MALAPLLWALTAGSGGRAFLLGLVAGLVYFTGTLYWITRVMAVYGGLQWMVAVLVNAALIVYLALFPAVFALLTRRFIVRFGTAGLMAAPFVWVAAELGRTHLFTGFPWVLLGYSQWKVLPIAQLASLFGVYGVSALVAAVSAAIVAAGPRQPAGSSAGPPTGRPDTDVGSHMDAGSRMHVGSGFSRIAPLAAVLTIVVAVALWGAWRIGRGELTRGGTPVDVGLVQGNVAQEEKWNPARAPGIFGDYLRMTRQAIAKGADLVLWPESALPYAFEHEPVAAGMIRGLARESGVPILIGSDQIDRGVPTRYFNAAYLIRADGSTGGVYRKMHLVPFGEYVPLKRVFFFAAPLVEAVSDFSAGESPEVLPVNGHSISTAICYEIVYPDLVRQFVARGSELLTTITNDAWFGRTAAPYQHFAQASMRAVENGRYLVRAANTGISGVVDPYGRVVVASGIFEPAVIVSPVRYLTASTLYTRTGDLFAYASLALTIALLIGSGLHRHADR